MNRLNAPCVCAAKDKKCASSRLKHNLKLALKQCLHCIWPVAIRYTSLYIFMNYSGTVAEIEECQHPTVMKEMCAECGADLRTDESTKRDVAVVPMVHSVPELKVPMNTIRLFDV